MALAAARLSVLAVAGAAMIAAAPVYRAPRTADGRPNLNGIWQAVNTAHWDLQDHPAGRGPVIALGAAFSIPGGQGVVDGGVIPYQPWAATKKQENAANWLSLDPEVKCYRPGIPRATYMPYPFQIVQTPGDIFMAYEFAGANRTIFMNKKKVESPVDFWMGWSQGHWEGEALVIDVTGFNDQTWFDRAGNFHSDALHVVERYTATSPNSLLYEVTIDDSKVFTRPWKISMPLYRRLDAHMQLLEYKCVEFVEELMYGHLSRQPAR